MEYGIIWSRHYNPWIGWETAELIETEDLGDAVSPQIVIHNNTANAIAVWTQSNGTVNNIYSNTSTGTIWGTAGPIELNAGNEASPKIAIDSNGNAIAVWEQWGSVTTIMTNIFY